MQLLFIQAMQKRDPSVSCPDIEFHQYKAGIKAVAIYCIMWDLCAWQFLANRYQSAVWFNDLTFT